MIRTRLSLPLLAALAAIAIAGCGSSGGDSNADLAGFAPPGSLIFVEGKVRPSGELKAEVDAIASTVAGVDNLGDRIVSELESEARDDGEPFDFEKEVEPWLGERASVAFRELDEDGDPSNPVVAIEATDTDAAQEFIDNQARQGGEYEDVSYEGIDFKVGGEDDNGVGVIDDFLVIAEGEAGFKAAVDAAQGESLAEEARFSDAIAAVSDGSLADVYVDVGGVIDASGDEIDPQVREALDGAGVDPSKATAVASVIPGTDQIQVDISSDLDGEEAPSGDASELIGSLPADSVVAAGSSEFGDQVKKAIDELDTSGIPGELPPNQLKNTLKAVGIDLDKIAESLEDGAAFIQGNSEVALHGALVLTSSSNEAAKTVANLGTLLRNTGTPGVTGVTSGGASGFSVRSEELGDKPLVVVAKGKRIVIGYGLPAALQGLNGEGEALSENSTYQAAVSSLGGTPISAYADGPEALLLAESLMSPTEREELQEARPYLKKIEYIAVSNESNDGLATAKLILGLEK